ncbi:MAG TPA: hypothetical protein VIQ80_00960 [Candidatus Saccharimonadales bacterium]
MKKQHLSYIHKKIQFILATLLFVVSVGSASLFAAPVTHAADASYSCGSYGAGAYSTNVNCATGAPNTGFNGVVNKIMQPANLAAIIASLLLLTGGIVLLVRSSKKRKKAVAFSTRNE